MEINKKAKFIAEKLQEKYPQTECFLHYKKAYELLFAVILSAQATDKSVNLATEKLFALCPSLEDYKIENQEKILACIKPVGLSKNKCQYLLETAKILQDKYHGEVPRLRDELMTLPGVGYKTSGVVLAELYNDPYIPVDTHVFRVSHRLGIVKDSLTPEKTEIALEKLFKGYVHIHLHRQLILLGREVCKAKNESCLECPMKEVCSYFKKKNK